MKSKAVSIKLGLIDQARGEAAEGKLVAGDINEAIKAVGKVRTVWNNYKAAWIDARKAIDEASEKAKGQHSKMDKIWVASVNATQDLGLAPHSIKEIKELSEMMAMIEDAQAAAAKALKELETMKF